jgi:tRNA(Ile)-lysidine synthase
VASLPDRLRARWEAGGWTRPGDRVVVACSGGVDSVVLLYLLRFSLPVLGLGVDAAHFDHAMREGSGRDGLWLRGLARAWDVPLHEGKAPRTPGSEEDARRLRYDFLERVRRERKARWILTAHHANDQVETVLFRIVRGTGLRGLRGIPTVRAPGILRPLLPFSRDDVEEYARDHRIPRRDDPTNLTRAYGRNRIRLDVLPLLEEVHPGARQGLLRLARNAARTVDALDELLVPLEEEVVLERGEGFLVVDREDLAHLAPSVRRALLRRLIRVVGPVPGEAGTGRALSFITTGPSGGRLELPGGVTLRRDFDRMRIDAGAAALPRSRGEGEEASLVISGPEGGEGELGLAGRRFNVRWGRGDQAGGNGEEGWCASFDPRTLEFPLELRGWRPGDRTRTPWGGRKLKKLFGELRIPVGERHALPLLVDASGLVLWIPGKHRVPAAHAGPSGEAWVIGVADGQPT